MVFSGNGSIENSGVALPKCKVILCLVLSHSCPTVIFFSFWISVVVACTRGRVKSLIKTKEHLGPITTVSSAASALGDHRGLLSLGTAAAVPGCVPRSSVSLGRGSYLRHSPPSVECRRHPWPWLVLTQLLIALCLTGLPSLRRKEEGADTQTAITFGTHYFYWDRSGNYGSEPS